RFLAGDQGDQADHQCRTQQRTHQQRDHHRAAIAEQVEQFLLQYSPAGIHANSPSSDPIALTKASSRLSWPVCWRSSSGEPWATTRPLATITMRSHRAATSCMMWL